VFTINTILFDFDGVLAKLDPSAASSFFGRLVPLPLDDLTRRWTEWVRTHEPMAGRLPDFWSALQDELGLPAEAVAELVGADYRSMYSGYPETRYVLSEVRRRELRVVVLSNNPVADLRGPLESLGLTGLVDEAFTPEDVGAAKPSLTAYRRVLDALAVDARECVFVDDELPNVMAAAELGLHAFHIDRRPSRPSSSASLADLQALLPVLDRGRGF
jgi:HAD superfamily hydrolase (TIGR01509 family)